MRARSVLTTVAVLAIALTAPRLSAAGAGPSADVLCSYLESGVPGPAGNELQITTNDYVGEVTINRDGDEILVSQEVGSPLDCSGPASPSVTNLDAINVRVSREDLDSLNVDLRTGPIGPGASVEFDGASEIEISLLDAPGTVLSVMGTAASEVMELGSLGGGNYGANLNAVDEETSDVDAIGRNGFVSLVLGAGDDRVDPTGSAEFATRAFNFSFAALGRNGDDVLIGNDRRNFLTGDRGRDELVGAGLGDQLFGGRNRDRIDSRDRFRDVVHCGRGRDALRADRADELRDCE